MVKEAWTETVTEDVYDPWECCNVCGADITANVDEHIKQHMMNGEGGKMAHRVLQNSDENGGTSGRVRNTLCSRYSSLDRNCQ